MAEYSEAATESSANMVTHTHKGNQKTLLHGRSGARGPEELEIG
jgi:hypothetical protein